MIKLLKKLYFTYKINKSFKYNEKKVLKGIEQARKEGLSHKEIMSLIDNCYK